MSNTPAVVDMDAHFDIDGAMEELARKRFSMPPPVVAAFRQAAMKGAARLLDLVQNDEKFEKLRTSDQLKVLEMIFDRAYGKAETASMSAMTNAKLGLEKDSDHSDQLEKINQRAAQRKLTKQPSDDEQFAKAGSIASLDVFPEMRKRRAAAEDGKVVNLPRRPL